MRIGLLRERIEFQANTPVVDAEGQSVPSWSTLARGRSIPARAEFLHGRELEAAQKINSLVMLRFTVRYRTDLTVTQRILWRSSYWNIHGLLPDERISEMAILVSKVE